MKRAIRVGGIAAFVFLCLVLLVGFLAVSFEAALYFLVGLLASLVALGLLPRFLARISLLLAAATALLIAAASIVSIHYGIIVGAGPTAMTGYQAELVPDPHSNDPNRFLLSEHFQYIHPPAARHGDTYGQFTGSEVIEARSNGFAVHEIDFSPLSTLHGRVLYQGRYPFLRFFGKAGKHVDVVICTEPCNNTSVMLRGFPPDSFWQANSLSTVQLGIFGDTEMAAWNLNNVDRPVKFTYIDAPWRQYRDILTPYFGVTSLNNAIPIAFGCLLTVTLAGTLPAWLVVSLVFLWHWIRKLAGRWRKPKPGGQVALSGPQTGPVKAKKTTRARSGRKSGRRR
jgi:hypothetical protein